MDSVSSLIKFSAVLKEIKMNIKITQWLIESLNREKRVSVKIGNALLTKIADFLLGIIVLYFFFKHEQQILVFIRDIAEVR